MPSLKDQIWSDYNAFVDTPEVEEICDFIGNQQAYPQHTNFRVRGRRRMSEI